MPHPIHLPGKLTKSVLDRHLLLALAPVPAQRLDLGRIGAGELGGLALRYTIEDMNNIVIALGKVVSPCYSSSSVKLFRSQRMTWRIPSASVQRV